MRYESPEKALQEKVDDAYRLLGTRKHGVGCFPTFLLICLERRVWESEREDASGKAVPPCSFHDFVHKPYPYGIDSSYEAIEAIIRAEPPVVTEWQRVSGRTIDKAPLALPIANIRADGGTQSRATIDDTVVAEYQEHLKSLPPVVVFYDGADHWLADGFHRLEAHKRASLESITAEVRQGTRRDAVLFSVGANSAHGLRRTKADKRRAVELLLRDAEWSKKSDRWVANRCGVHQTFVGKVRGQLSTVDSSVNESRLGQDGKTRKLPERRQQPAPDTLSTAAETGQEAPPAPEEPAGHEPSAELVAAPAEPRVGKKSRAEARNFRARTSAIASSRWRAAGPCMRA